MTARCEWVTDDPLYIRYHDQEWGVPVYDDRTLFEFLVLEGAQAGLSWLTVLRKREAYREAYGEFDPHRVANYDDRNIERLTRNPGIIRNRLKIMSAINNAQKFLGVQEEYGSFSRFLWDFVGHRPEIHHWTRGTDVPTQSEAADALSRALKGRGFTFVGTTICYAYMQATGLVMDHLTMCFRYADLSTGLR